MSRDHEVTNESAHCWEKFSSYITIGPFIREKSRGLHKTRKEPFCEYVLHKTRTARINASQLYSSRPHRSNDVLACLLPAVTSSEQNSETIWLWSFSFQINISVNISVGLLRTFCGNLDENFVSD